MKPELAWHFVGATLRNGDPIPPDGVWLHYKFPIVMCSSGLHASRKIIDALSYAPGNTICRVEVKDIVEEGEDKLVARSRKILWRINGEKILRRFAKDQALSVIHLWDAPSVVKEYLKSNNENNRHIAWASTRSAAGGAAGDAAWSADWSAARDAAWSAAWSAAGGAAGGAAGDAAWSAARDAAWDAAWGAAGDAAWSAARDAAWDAAWDAANDILTTMIEKANLGPSR